MIALELDNDEQWAVLWALLDSYVARVGSRDKCREIAKQPQVGPIEPAKFAQWADDDELKLAELDAIIAKFPERKRQAWAEQLVRRLTEATERAA